MEEALQQLSTGGLESAKRKSMGSSGQITVTMDTRALAPDHRIHYRNLHKFRVAQMNDGIDLTDLTDEQWGMVPLDKCHHISTTSTSKDGPQSFRVRICKTCCQEDSHIELGTYVDQESAILVNDTFEILNERLDRLIVLRVDDKPDLRHLVAKKYDRSKGRDYACILDLISERISAIEGKKHKPSTSEIIPAFAKRTGELTSNPSGTDFNSSTVYSSCSTSSEASDEQRTASRLAGSASKLSSAAAPLTVGRPTPLRRTSSSARKLSIGSAHDGEAGSQSGSASTIDDDITVPEETNTALRELSSVCYQRLLSPSINPTIPGSAHLSPGTLLTGTSLFGAASNTGSTADLVRSLERARVANSTISSVTNSTSKNTAVGERLHLGSPFSNTSSSTAPLHSDSPPAPSSSAANDSYTAGTNSGSTNKRTRPALDESAVALGGVQANERLMSLEGLTPRKRAATFSVSEPYPYHYADAGNSNPIATLTWLASMEECEVDVARSLFELRGSTEGASSLFDTRSAMNMALGIGSPGGAGGFGSYLSGGMGYSRGSANAGQQMDYGGDDGEEYYDQEGEEGENDDDEDMEEEESAYYQLHAHMAGGSGKPGSKPVYGFPSTYPHNSKLLSAANGTAGTGAAPQRARSSSMSMIDRSEAAWAILGNTGGYRSRMDPLSMALKKYHERGGSANAAACGFVGIYSPEDRKQRILRFLEKRKRRMWTKKVKYDVRKNFADSRVRVKGRFVKKQDEEAAGADGDRLNSSHLSHSSFDGDGAEDGHYDHNDVDLELLEQLNAAQQLRRDSTVSPKNIPHESSAGDAVDGSGSTLKLKISKSAAGSGNSGAKKRADGTPKSEVKVENSKGTGDLKLTISSRRRRNSRAEDAEGEGSAEATSGVTTDGRDASSGNSPSAVAVRLERANLDSAVKPAPPSSS